ncbi:hypothetical protein WOSG25_090450 [Weissella oryzae SG25]|uniref:Uncharacterized protein n=1 Tax=Weissella oryzae (strain DSM 25784 / JCM 18191 / LMG 30913 / SG25) TaxID=1329250 RepID=A0A069CVW5_WEIOS|nr:hypothetical protein [Weissella oryzae]GAK31348.1 hypothetical protein WOSG25_090450 [Weissella oryzae SG25]
MASFERIVKNPVNEGILIKWYEDSGYKVTAKTRTVGAKNGQDVLEHYLNVVA